MSMSQFLFGKKGRADAPLSDKIKSSAKNKLDSKIIRNPWNVWWVVLVRQYLLYPIFKLPLLPVQEAFRLKQRFSAFGRAIELMHDNGMGDLKARAFLTSKEKAAIKGASVRFQSFVAPVFAVFWKPRGHPIAVEQHLTLKLFFLTMVSWLVSMALFSFAGYRISQEGFRTVSRDFVRLYSSLDLSYSYGAASSSSFKLWLFGVIVWCVSFLFCVLLANRKWIKLSDRAKRFMVENGFKEEEIETKSIILMIPELVFLSIPSVSLHRVRPLQHGWPAGFLPGEIYENIKNPSEILILQRPPRDPIIFGGPHANSDVGSHLAAYERGIIANLKARRKSPADPEYIFLGEIIDPRWWRSSHIYMPLSTNPHMVVVGQTRSGKSKGILSFVYSFARAYPETVWYFADGKGSPDYDPFADSLSEYPVAKPDDKGDPLIQFANIIDVVWAEYGRRLGIFEAARLDGKPCSTIYQYRELVGPLPQIWLVIDEFSVFNMEMDFDPNYKVAGTIANRLKRLAAESASYGIHLLIASQRYQQTDVPTVLRSNLVARIIYNVQMSDANFLAVEEATKLRTGQAFVSASGLYCEFTGLNIVKSKLPYIGDKPDALLAKTITPIAKDKKKQFDPFLTYNKGTSDLDDMSVTEFCVRLHKFFRDQNYIVQDLDKDPEAIEMQMHIIKARRRTVDMGDGSTTTELDPTGDPAIGVSILKSDELDEDTLLGIQDKYSNYPTIIVFVMGKNINSQKYRFVRDLNEKGSRFFVYPSKDYKKDFRYVEMKRRQGTTVDLVKSKLQRLGLADVSHEVAAKNISWEEISKKSPMRLRVSKILEEFGLDTTHKETDALRGIPYVSTMLPGGTELYILIVSEKGQRDDAKILAANFYEQDSATVIVSDEKFTVSDLKILMGQRTIVWRSSQIDEWVTLGKEKKLGKGFMAELIKSLGIVKPDNQILYGKNARLTFSCDVAADGLSLPVLKIGCDVTGYSLISYRDLDIEQYRLEALGIPETAKIVVTNGMAPHGADPANVKLRLSAKGSVGKLPAASKWEVDKGILRRKESAISVDDPMIVEMQKLK